MEFNNIKSAFKTNFFKNAMTLLSGTSSAQLILILISPVLTRIYSPEDFAVLALFTAITTITGIIANMKYDFAIGLPEKDSEAINILTLSIISSVIVSIIILLVIFLIPDQIVELLNNQGIKDYLYLIPAATFLIGVFNTLNYYNIRIKNFKNIARTNLYRQVISAIFQIIFGIFKEGPLGLIGGRVALHLAGNYTLAFRGTSLSAKLKDINKRDIKDLSVRYKRFPIFTLPAQLSNVAAQQINNVFISSLYAASTLGFYALLNRVVNMPLSLISTSFGQVYLQRATEEKNKLGNSKNVYIKTFYWLGAISLVIFLPFYFLVEPVFGFVFGNEWLIAGTYTKILIPLFVVRFISAPLSLTNIVYEKQLFGLLWQVGLLVLTITIYIVTKQFGLEMELFLEITTYTLSIYYIALMFATYRFAKGS